jgi:hypothetical protein
MKKRKYFAKPSPPKEMTVGQLMDTEKFQEEFNKDHLNQIKNKKNNNNL